MSSGVSSTTLAPLNLIVLSGVSSTKCCPGFGGDDDDDDCNNADLVAADTNIVDCLRDLVNIPAAVKPNCETPFLPALLWRVWG